VAAPRHSRQAHLTLLPLAYGSKSIPIEHYVGLPYCKQRRDVAGGRQTNRTACADRRSGINV